MQTPRCSEAVAYAAYMTTNTFLSSAVVAAVLFYGGTLVLRGAMSAGALVSFMLFQQSLSAAFTSLGDVFSALSAAVGAADKVVELMRRPPRIAERGTLAPATFAGKITLQVGGAAGPGRAGWLACACVRVCVLPAPISCLKAAPQPHFPLTFASHRAAAPLQDVVFHYPARPSLRVLNGVSLSVHPGEIVALVGPSGGGKSSIVKLVERFYLPDDGAAFETVECGLACRRCLDLARPLVPSPSLSPLLPLPLLPPSSAAPAAAITCRCLLQGACCSTTAPSATTIASGSSAAWPWSARSRCCTRAAYAGVCAGCVRGH